MTEWRSAEAPGMAVLVTNDFPPNHGGIQRCMSSLAQELTLRNESIVVVAPKTTGSAWYDAGQRFRVSRYPGPGRLASFAAMTLWLLGARLRTRDSYTVASIWFPAGLAACLIPRLVRGKLAVFAHGTEIAPGRGGLRKQIMRYVFDHADVIIANSRFTRDLLVRAGVTRKVVVVHSGIDAQPIAPARAAIPTILSVGRLVARKGFDTMIAAMPAVLERFPSARYEIVGGGPQRAELEALAQRLGVGDHVSFLGAVDDRTVREAYARAWCFGLPVRAIGDDVEGFGLVYLEAALADLPVIGGRNSGAEDAIAPGESGLLVDGTSNVEVADAIVSLLENPERARLMGVRGRERALNHFTWRRTAEEVARVMEETVRQASSRVVKGLER